MKLTKNTLLIALTIFAITAVGIKETHAFAKSNIQGPIHQPLKDGGPRPLCPPPPMPCQ